MYCLKCGAVLEEGVKFCQNCGEALNSNQVICLKCGASVKKSEEKVETTAPAPNYGGMPSINIVNTNNNANTNTNTNTNVNGVGYRGEPKRKWVYNEYSDR